MLRKLAQILLGDDTKLRALLYYWAGTGLFYVLTLIALNVQVHAGTASADGVMLLNWFAGSGVLFFFVLVRLSDLLRITPRQLALLQALFAITCNVVLYLSTGPLRGAGMMGLLVVVVFCTFSLRPRATLGICAVAIIALGLTMTWGVLHDPMKFPLREEVMHFVLACLALLAVTLLAGEMSRLRARLKQREQELETALSKIRTLATIDELTNLANRRYMNEVLTEEERRSQAHDRPTCIALIDIDFFKSVNDRFGHDGGDAVLRTFADTARTQLRSADLLARWGGEEFLLMLPHTDIEVAQRVLKRIADSVRAVTIPGFDIRSDVTFSAGLVQRHEGEPFADTISRADKIMYGAKQAGRNRVLTG